MQITDTKTDWKNISSYFSGGASIISILLLYKSIRFSYIQFRNLIKALQFNENQAFQKIVSQANQYQGFLIKNLETSLARETFDNHYLKKEALGTKIKNVPSFQVTTIGGKVFLGKALNKSKFYNIKCECSQYFSISNGCLNQLMQIPNISKIETVMSVYGTAKFMKAENIIHMKVQKIGTDFSNLQSMWLNILEESLLQTFLISSILGILISFTINIRQNIKSEKVY